MPYSKCGWTVFVAAIGLTASPTFAEDAGVALELPVAQALAIEHQPMLEAQAAAVKAARDNAIASAQLPDPKLTGGITDYPINGPDRYSLRRDDFTMVNIGVMQEFPRGDKRRLIGERGQHEADMADRMLTTSRLSVQRDAALAWIDVWRQEQALALAKASLREADLQAKATEIAYTNSRSTQADYLAAKVALGLLRDEVAALEQDIAVSRSKLGRWIGTDAAQRLLCPELPDFKSPAPLEEMVGHLRHHPHLDTEAQRVAIAQDEVALAEQSYKPDWGAELGYGYRPDFSDYVSLNFTIDLPVFTGNRQDKALSSKLAAKNQAEQTQADVLRQAEAELRTTWIAWQRLQSRINDFDAAILPQSDQRVNAALAAWQSGQGTLSSVLDARRMSLENQTKRLDLTAEAARNRVQLMYFAGEPS